MTKQTYSSLWRILTLSVLSACETDIFGGSSGEQEEENGCYINPTANLDLTLDTDPAVEGWARIIEYEIPDGTYCTGGITLFVEASGGIYLPINLSFIDRNPDTASTAINDEFLSWDSTTEDTATTPLYKWSGTYVISNWSEKLLELLLTDGTRCDYYNDTMCVPSVGSLIVSGKRGGPHETEGDGGYYEDVASGESICTLH